MWLLDYEPEIRSDLSVFHGVRDPEELGSSRYYELVPLLGHYGGALRNALIRDHPDVVAQAVPASPRTTVGVTPGLPPGHQVVDDVKTFVAMTNDDPRFPGIEYEGA